MTPSKRKHGPHHHSLLSLVILALLSILSKTNAICSIDADNTAVDCMYGLWNENTCECECIPPYCPDLSGQCAAMYICNPTNPWANCVRGVNCPWWKNTLKANSCATGPEVPYGIWEVWATQYECCNLYPQSEACLDYKKNPVTKHPTPYPTIGAAQLPDTELISIRFPGVTIPVGVEIVNFQNRLREVLKSIVLDLAQQYSLLKILNIEYRTAYSRNDDIIFDITVARQDDVQFASIIGDAIRDRITYIFNNMVEWLRLQNISESDYRGIEFCFDWDGRNYCSTRSPTRSPTPGPTVQPKEVVRVAFLDIELPIDVSMAEFKIKMRDLVKKIVLDLADKYGSLKILDVKLVGNRRDLAVEANEGGGSTTELGNDGGGFEGNRRSLQRAPFDLFYDVTIIREPGIDFGPIIQAAFSSSNDIVMEEINDWIRNNQGVYNDRPFSFCLDSSDGYECYSGSSRPTRRPTRRPTARPTSPATETLVVEFTDVTLPISADYVQFREELRIKLRSIVDDLAERYKSLTILDVKYSGNRRALELRHGEKNRHLQRVVDLTYDITYKGQDGVDFRGVILDAVLASNEGILLDLVEWLKYQDLQDEEDAFFSFCLNSDCFALAPPGLAPSSPSSSAASSFSTSNSGVMVYPADTPMSTFTVEFEDVRLPRSIRVNKFREQLRVALKNILDDVADRYETLTIVSVKSRDDRRRVTVTESGYQNRSLQQVVDLAYDVTILGRSGIDFRSIIIDAVYDSNEIILIDFVEWIKDQDIDKSDDPTFSFCLKSDCFSQGVHPSPTTVVVAVPGKAPKPTSNPTPPPMFNAVYIPAAPTDGSPNKPKPVQPSNGNEYYFEEVFPIRFSVRGLPRNIKDQKKLRWELQDVLKDIMLYLADEYDFKLLKVEYRNAIRVETRAMYEDGGADSGPRALETQAVGFVGVPDNRLHHMMFDVTIGHEGDIDLEDLIRRNYDVLVQYVRENSWDYEAVTSDFEFEVCIESESCTAAGGEEITYTYNNNSEFTTKSVDADETYLIPRWAIILIVVFIVLLCCLCCICVASCARYRKWNDVKKEIIENNVDVTRSRNESKRSPKSRSDSDSDSSETSSDESEARPRMYPQHMLAMQPYHPRPLAPNQLALMPPPQYPQYPRLPPSQPQYPQLPPPQQPQYRQLPPAQPHPYQPIIQNNIPQQSPPALALLNRPHQPSKSDSTAYSGKGSTSYHDGDFSSAQYSVPVGDTSIGGIDSQSYADFDSIVRPDPSMYSLFTTRSMKSKKSNKSRNSKSKRTPREPSVYSNTKSKSTNREPSLYLEYGGDDAPGFKSGDSVYFRDNQSVRDTTKLLLCNGPSEDNEENSLYYLEHHPMSVHQVTHDESSRHDSANAKSLHTARYPASEKRSRRDTISNLQTEKSQQQFTFPDSNDVMSMISGMTDYMEGVTNYSQQTFSTQSHKSKEAKDKKEKARKSTKTKKKKKKSKEAPTKTSQSMYYEEKSPALDRTNSLPRDYLV